MTTYAVYGDINHKNKTYSINVMPTFEFIKLYGQHFTKEGAWLGAVPFALLFMKLDLEMALHRKKSYELDYAKQGYALA